MVSAGELARDGDFRRRGERRAGDRRPAARKQPAARGGRGSRAEGSGESRARSRQPATQIDGARPSTTKLVKRRRSSSSPTKLLSDGPAASPQHSRRRSLRSLQSRWDLIKEIVGKFVGYVLQVERANPSGYGDSDKIAMACAAYAEMEKGKFTLMHCYELMKDEPKWMDSKHNKGPRQTEVDTQSYFTPIGENMVQQSVDDSNPTPSPGKGSKRPMGREASKNKSRKTSSSSSAASEFVSQLQVLSLDKEKYWKQESERRASEHNDFLMLERDKLALQRQAEERQAQQMQRAEDERILGIDLEKCATEALRTYYATLQQEILKRIKQAAANRGK